MVLCQGTVRMRAAFLMLVSNSLQRPVTFRRSSSLNACLGWSGAGADNLVRDHLPDCRGHNSEHLASGQKVAGLSSANRARKSAPVADVRFFIYLENTTCVQLSGLTTERFPCAVDALAQREVRSGDPACRVMNGAGTRRARLETAQTGNKNGCSATVYDSCYRKRCKSTLDSFRSDKLSLALLHRFD
jgi:hypothetical protein